MKIAILFSLLVSLLGFSSCAKDSNDSQTAFESLMKQSEVTVNVTYQIWNDSPSTLSCDGSGLGFILFLEDAVVSLSKGDQKGADDSGFQRQAGYTNRSGSITFSDLEPGTYTIIVGSEFGEESKVIQVYENVQSLINFRF
jgi:hypothetical protein